MNPLLLCIASYPKFDYWGYDVLFWKRLLGQWSFYIKQNFGENGPTINDLHVMLQWNNYLELMSQIQYYAKNIVCTNSYWYQVKQQLKQHCNSIVLPRYIFTLSCVELHWPEFYASFGDASNDYLHYKSNAINNSYVLDCFFTEKNRSICEH